MKCKKLIINTLVIVIQRLIEANRSEFLLFKQNAKQKSQIQAHRKEKHNLLFSAS